MQRGEALRARAIRWAERGERRGGPRKARTPRLTSYFLFVAGLRRAVPVFFAAGFLAATVFLAAGFFVVVFFTAFFATAMIASLLSGWLAIDHSNYIRSSLRTYRI